MEKKIRDGYETFLNDYLKKNAELFKDLSHHQHPHTMVITCSDSRINPDLLFNTHPGDLFIARNIGNVVPPYQPAQGATQAAIEYAVNVLNVPKIVILGHSDCGACAYMYHKKKEDEIPLPHVEEWLKYLTPAKSAALLEIHADHSKNIFQITEKDNVVVSLQRLMEYPYIQNRLINNEIDLEGWWYDIGTGRVEVYNFNTKGFEAAI